MSRPGARTSAARAVAGALAGVAVALAGAAPLAARGDERGPGFGAAVRFAYSLPSGESTKGVDLSKSYAAALPVWLEFGYRFNGWLSAGVYGQYAYGFVSADTCPSDASCSGAIWKVGVEGLLNLRPGATIDPWVGLGFGYEWASVSRTMSGQAADASSHGFELLLIQGGVDFELSDRFGLGPFLSLGIDQYSGGSTTANGTSASGDAGSQKSVHRWMQLGVRGHYTL